MFFSSELVGKNILTKHLNVEQFGIRKGNDKSFPTDSCVVTASDIQVSRKILSLCRQCLIPVGFQTILKSFGDASSHGAHV